MKLSVTNTLWDGPTLRQNAVGIPGGSTRTYSTGMLGIDKVDCPFGGVGIETVLEPRRCPSRRDRGAGEAIVPGDGHSFRIETGGNPIEPVRPVHVVLDIFLTRPHDFHRAVDMLRDLDGAGGTVGPQPPPEAPADQVVVDDDLVQGQAGGLRGRRLDARHGLAA